MNSTKSTAKKRNGFASKLGFILAAAGSAVGLGNLWAFPYKTGAYGGAAFVLVYILMVLLIGISAMIAEVFLGKRAHANPVTAFKKVHKNLGAAGLLAVVVPFIIITYYAVLGGYSLRCVVSSWTDVGKDASAISEGMTNFMAGDVLPVACTVLFILLTVGIIVFGVQKGIESAAKVLMPALVVILVGVVIYALTLGEGVREGLDFYILKVDFGQLGFQGIIKAMGQAFFSMSLGMGIMISYGSYAGEDVKIGKSALQVCLIDSAIALLAGFAIFPAAYHFMAVQGVAAEELGLGGFALMFFTLPQVFASMGTVGALVGSFFFLMVLLAALTSLISLVEVVVQFVIQNFRVSRKIACTFPILLLIGISIPVTLSLGGSFTVFGFDLLTFFDEITNTAMMPLTCLAGVLTVGWLIDRREFVAAVDPDHPLTGKIVSFMIRFVTPLLILAVEVFGIYDQIVSYRDAGSSYLPVLVASGILIALCAGVYFLFLKNAESGCNEDELKR